MRRLLLSTTAIATVVAALVLAPTQVDAHSAVSKQQAFSGSVVGYAGGDYFATELQIPAFNSNQGGLQSILVFQGLKANYGGTAHFTNRTSTAAGGSITTGAATTQATLSMKTPLRITGGPSVLQGSAVLTVAADESGLVLTYNEPGPISASNSVSKGPLDYVDVADWEVPGGGTLVADLESVTTAVNPEPGLVPNIVPTLAYTLTGVYNYTTTSGPIPEPVSALMLGSGVLALGAARRRRSRKG
jgi:hypothetical protein